MKYVGKTNSPIERYRNHLNKARDGGTYKRNWINSLRKKGMKPVFEIIKEIPIDEWKFLEKYYIKYYKDKGCKLVNLMDGGEGLSFGNQTSFKKGSRPWNYGIKQKIVKKCGHCNIEFSPRDKRQTFCSRSCAAKAVTGFKKGHVPWSKGRTGWTTGRKGQKVSEEVKKKISNTLKGKLNGSSSKPVVQVDINTNDIIKEYPSAAEAWRVTDINSSRIINTTNGYSKTAGGFKWKRKENL